MDLDSFETVPVAADGRSMDAENLMAHEPMPSVRLATAPYGSASYVRYQPLAPRDWPQSADTHSPLHDIELGFGSERDMQCCSECGRVGGSVGCRMCADSHEPVIINATRSRGWCGWLGSIFMTLAVFFVASMLWKRGTSLH